MKQHEVVITGFGRTKPVMVVNVRLAHLFRFRVWLGLKIVQLGAWIATVGFEVKDEENWE